MEKTNKSGVPTQTNSLDGVKLDSRNTGTQECNIFSGPKETLSTKTNAIPPPRKVIESMPLENNIPSIFKNEREDKVLYPGQSSVSDSRDASLSIGPTESGFNAFDPFEQQRVETAFVDQPLKPSWPIEPNGPSAIGGCNGGAFLKNLPFNVGAQPEIKPQSEPTPLDLVPTPSNLITRTPLDPYYKDCVRGRQYRSFLPTTPSQAGLLHSNSLPSGSVANSIYPHSPDVPLIYPSDVRRNSHQFQNFSAPQFSQDIPLTLNSSAAPPNFQDVPLPCSKQPEKSIELNVGNYSAISINVVSQQLMQEVNQKFNYSGFNKNRTLP